MCCIGAALRLNLAPPRLSVADIYLSPVSLTSPLLRLSVADPVCRVARRNLSSQREALADIKTEVDKNQNVTRRSKHSGIWESVIGLEVHAQVTLNCRGGSLINYFVILVGECRLEDVFLGPHQFQCPSQLQRLIF